MTAWELYFLTIVGWQYHPGYCRDESKRMTLEQCADLANDMMEVADKWQQHGEQ